MGQAKTQRTDRFITNAVGMTVVRHIESRINQLHNDRGEEEYARFCELVRSGYFIEARNEKEMESILV